MNLLHPQIRGWFGHDCMRSSLSLPHRVIMNCTPKCVILPFGVKETRHHLLGPRDKSEETMVGSSPTFLFPQGNVYTLLSPDPRSESEPTMYSLMPNKQKKDMTNGPHTTNNRFSKDISFSRVRERVRTPISLVWKTTRNKEKTDTSNRVCFLYRNIG